MILAEFLFIALGVGIFTESWMGFFGTFFGLLALYRFTRLSASLALALSLYWGLLGYHLGAWSGEIVLSPLLAVVALAIGVRVHLNGFLAVFSGIRTTDPAPLEAAAACQQDSIRSAQALPDDSDCEIIDAEYRVVS